MSTSTNQEWENLGIAKRLLDFLRANRRKIAGKVITYGWISEEMGGVPPKTLQTWMKRLKKNGYVQVERHIWGMVIRGR